MNLCLDIGNTRAKVAIYKGKILQERAIIAPLRIANIDKWLRQYNIQHTILSSTRNHDPQLEKHLQEKTFFIALSHQTPLPIQLLYQTPETLGRDRIALAVAGNNYYPQNDVLVIDAGTCITYDFVDCKGNYHGGAIAPGVQMRFKALHSFTDKLPLVPFSSEPILIGQNTQQSILSGVVTGVLAEMDGIIQQYLQLYPSLKILLTGGDTPFFESRLKNEIFASSNLLLEGLNQILNYNATQVR